MIQSLENAFIEQLSKGLHRATITDAAKWACEYRFIKGKQWTFDRHPWLYEPHVWEDNHIVVQKAAQMGFTEWAMNKVFFLIGERNLDVLYVLPTTDDARDFSNGRFNPALEESEYLQSLFSDVDNVGLKRAGSNCLYVRGSKSRSKLKSIPVAVAMLDELAEMKVENIPLIFERQAGQSMTFTGEISTPTFENKNINASFKQSTQDIYTFKCPKCNRFTHFRFPEDLIVIGESANDPRLSESYVQCQHCKGKLPHEEKQEYLKHKAFGGTGHYVSQVEEARYRGCTVSQLYSMAKTPAKLAGSFFDAKSDPYKEQEFWNSMGGMVHESEGARVTDENLEACVGNFSKKTIDTNCFRTLGIDVGRVLHFVVKEWRIPPDFMPGLLLNNQITPKVVYEGESSGSANDFEEAHEIMSRYACVIVIVDAEPERRAAYNFVSNYPGRGFLCDYISSQKGKIISMSAEQELTVNVNRTSWLDLTLGRYKNGSIALPIDLSLDFKNHTKALVRGYKKNSDGHDIGYYENTSPDHFAHASLYAEVGLPIYFNMGQNKTIT